jgi:hypothetical protein
VMSGRTHDILQGHMLGNGYGKSPDTIGDKQEMPSGDSLESTAFEHLPLKGTSSSPPAPSALDKKNFLANHDGDSGAKANFGVAFDLYQGNDSGYSSINPVDDEDDAAKFVNIRVDHQPMSIIADVIRKNIMNSFLRALRPLPWIYEAEIIVLLAVGKFLDDQYGESTRPCLGSVITLSGSARVAQATSCRDYMKQNWPQTGQALLDTIQSAVNNGQSNMEGMTHWMSSSRTSLM